MSKITKLILLCLFWWTCTVHAQPILVIEHDWTFRIGAQRFGLVQSNIAPGDLMRRTTIYWGRALFSVRVRAGWLLAFGLVPAAGLLTVLMWRRSKKELER